MSDTQDPTETPDPTETYAEHAAEHPHAKSVKHGMHWLMAALASEQRGWTTVDENDDRVKEAVGVAKEHAGGDADISEADVLAAMHDHVNLPPEKQAEEVAAEEPETAPEPAAEGETTPAYWQTEPAAADPEEDAPAATHD